MTEYLPVRALKDIRSDLLDQHNVYKHRHAKPRLAADVGPLVEEVERLRDRITQLEAENERLTLRKCCNICGTNIEMKNSIPWRQMMKEADEDRAALAKVRELCDQAERTFRTTRTVSVFELRTVSVFDLRAVVGTTTTATADIKAFIDDEAEAAENARDWDTPMVRNKRAHSGDT